MIGILSLAIFYTIYNMLKFPSDIVTVFLNVFIIICFGTGIWHHIKNINKPITQELKNNFIWYLVFVGIVSAVIFCVYFYRIG